MPVKINDLTVPKEKLETEYQVVQVSRWQKEEELLGWTYECVLPKLRFEKISVKVESEFPVISKEELEKEGMAMIKFDHLAITPWGRVNGQFVSYGLSAFASKAILIQNK